MTSAAGGPGSGTDRDPTRGRTAANRCWTLTNMQEATPDVLTPMCWSMWTPIGEVGARRAWYDLGIVPRSMVRLPTDENEFVMSPFFGRQALNVDRLATLMGALPGTSRETVERDMLGTARTNRPDDRAPRGRTPFILVKAPKTLVTQRRRVDRLYPGQVAWWRSEVLDGTDLRGRELLRQSRDRLLTAAIVHGTSRFLTQAVQGALGHLAAVAGRPDLATRVYGGFGAVPETAIAESLWAMSRGELGEREFVRLHGFHGRGVGNISGVPWRLDPTSIRSMAAALASRPDRARPRSRETAAVAARTAAERELRAALPRSRRPLLTALTRSAATQVRCMERTKAMFLMALDGARAACAVLGPELAAAGHLDEPADVVFLTADELLGEPPKDAAELAAFRRARRDEYRTLTVPTTFVGMPTPSTAPAGADRSVREISGVPGSAGTAIGPARVIVDLDEAGTIESGEVLVCRSTDPAWVAAMALADALVIDIGAPSSHGAIVARELGIPCVIGTGVGTLAIGTGDLVRVDGTAGTVEILARSEPLDGPSKGGFE